MEGKARHTKAMSKIEVINILTTDELRRRALVDLSNPNSSNISSTQQSCTNERYFTIVNANSTSNPTKKGSKQPTDVFVEVTANGVPMNSLQQRLKTKSNSTDSDSDPVERLKNGLYQSATQLPPDLLPNISPLNLPKPLIDRMYSHQLEGVQWLYGRYLARSGGLLGDDMGLGKTFQVCSLLCGLLASNSIHRVLIICPISVSESWAREIANHIEPYVRRLSADVINADMSKNRRQRLLHDTFLSQSPRIVLTSYHLVANMIDDFDPSFSSSASSSSSSSNVHRKQWDYVILDEGHSIKNPSTKISKAVHRLQSHHRLLLTGTPIQNQLAEFWSLMNWTCKGAVLGSLSNFTSVFADPIIKGQNPQATPHQRSSSLQAAQALLETIRPVLLQRKKCERADVLAALPTKTEVVLWIPLSSVQRLQYEQYITSREVEKVLKGSRTSYPVEIINQLKTLCRHPFLVEASATNKQRQNTGPVEEDFDVDLDQHHDDIDNLNDAVRQLHLHIDQVDQAPVAGDRDTNASTGKVNASTASVFEIADRYPDNLELMQGSVKLRVLSKLCRRLLQRDHRILIFSQSRLMLDIIQLVLCEYGMASSRIDGTVAGKDRQSIIDSFNAKEANGPSICLLTTRACGYGITLTGADRVVIFDPSWNPAEDRQAVDRAYRIGQRKPVVVYRMIMAGSVEEKMYEKQVFKDGLRVVTESGTSSRYFSKEETSDLFHLGPVNQCVVMEKLWQRNNFAMTTFEDIDDHEPPHLYQEDDRDGHATSHSRRGPSIKGILGYSRHDTLYAEVRPIELQSRPVAQAGSPQELQELQTPSSGATPHKKKMPINAVNPESGRGNILRRFQANRPVESSSPRAEGLPKVYQPREFQQATETKAGMETETVLIPLIDDGSDAQPSFSSTADPRLEHKDSNNVYDIDNDHRHRDIINIDEDEDFDDNSNNSISNSNSNSNSNNNSYSNSIPQNEVFENEESNHNLDDSNGSNEKDVDTPVIDLTCSPGIAAIESSSSRIAQECVSEDEDDDESLQIVPGRSGNSSRRRFNLVLSDDESQEDEDNNDDEAYEGNKDSDNDNGNDSEKYLEEDLDWDLSGGIAADRGHLVCGPDDHDAAISACDISSGSNTTTTITISKMPLTMSTWNEKFNQVSSSSDSDPGEDVNHWHDSDPSLSLAASCISHDSHTIANRSLMDDVRMLEDSAAELERQLNESWPLSQLVSDPSTQLTQHSRDQWEGCLGLYIAALEAAESSTRSSSDSVGMSVDGVTSHLQEKVRTLAHKLNLL